MLAARIGAQGLALLFTVVIARRLGSAGFGEYAFMAACIFIGNAVSTFGTDMLLIREIAAQADFSRLPAALIIQLVLSAGFAALVWLGAPALPNQGQALVPALRIFSLALFPLSFFSIFTAALRGNQSIGSYALLNLAVPLLQLSAAWWVDGVVSLAVLLLIVQGIAALLAGIVCTRQVAGFWRGWRFSIAEFRSVAVGSAPLGLLSLLGMMYQKLGLTLLSVLGGPAPAGWLSAAQRPVEASKTGHYAVFTALYPGMARSWADPEGKAGWAETIRYSWKLLVAAACLAALALFLFAGPLVRLVYGAGFEPAIPALRILAWTLVPYTVNSFLTLSLVAARKESPVGWILTVSLAGLVLMSLWWIPLMGAEGAAWAILAADCLQAVILMTYRAAAHLSIQGGVRELSHLS
jgi:PST family polysaccharide transporter